MSLTNPTFYKTVNHSRFVANGSKTYHGNFSFSRKDAKAQRSYKKSLRLGVFA